MSDTPELLHAQTMRDIDFDGNCIVIADRALPAALLDALPDPLLVHGGEALKTLRSVEALAEDVLRRRSSRPMTLVAVGGGSVGDAVAFLASILWRGVDLWHVPTTLLAMIDSAHGGKTAVNLGTAKNQLGTWYPPSRIIIVRQCLATLDTRLRMEGMAELLKALWLADADTTATLHASEVEDCVFDSFDRISARLLQLIDRAIDIKRDIVGQDARETLGIRRVLNLGHTIGHALELTSGMGHGEAVAWGLATSLRFSRDMGMPAAEYQHLMQQLYPLLRPIPDMPDEQTLLEAMKRDKKHNDDALHSVILLAAGKPSVTTSIMAREWVAAFVRTVREITAMPVEIRVKQPRPVTITLEAGKSELNRALIIAVQRMGRTRILGRSEADDVRHLVQALRDLGYPLQDTADGFLVDQSTGRLEDRIGGEERVVHAGEGGTTFRFLAALCCSSLKPTRIFAAPSLLRRPHEALFRSLRSAGARIEPFDSASGSGIVVQGWEQQPGMFSVEAEGSSQYASALALLSVGAEHPFTLRLLSHPSSSSYFDMTLRMLHHVGVETIAHGDLIAFNQTEGLKKDVDITVEADAGSRAVWVAASMLGHPARVLPPVERSLQPDSAMDELAWRIRNSSEQELVLDLSLTPDLLPLLAALSAGLRKNVRFTGLATLPHKESDRLHAFADTLNDVGIAARAEHTDLCINGADSHLRPGSRFRTLADHRIVMTAALLALVSDSIIVEHPWCVGKSYAAFWNDAREAGWTMLPAGSAGDGE
jgi:3-phosphoshikimate 1-carboxyvinyltransferase